MNDHLNDLEFEPVSESVLRAPGNRKRNALIFFVVLGIAIAAAAYLWLNYDGIARTAFSTTQPAPEQPETRAEGALSLEAFQAFQKQNGDSLQALNDNLATQKAELQRLSEQLSALAARLDATQRQASTLPPPPVIPEQPAVRPAKKPSAAKKPGPVSVGGAPLPAAPSDGH